MGTPIAALSGLLHHGWQLRFLSPAWCPRVVQKTASGLEFRFKMKTRQKFW